MKVIIQLDKDQPVQINKLWLILRNVLNQPDIEVYIESLEVKEKDKESFRWSPKYETFCTWLEENLLDDSTTDDYDVYVGTKHSNTNYAFSHYIKWCQLEGITPVRKQEEFIDYLLEAGYRLEEGNKIPGTKLKEIESS